MVFYDRLANPEILEWAAPMVPKVDVGKAATAGGASQKETNARLIQAARDGHIVARLKGGDPMLFGRGGEEALACAEAGVRFEIVPGITSALAAPAYAGIPVTHRGMASCVSIVTGQGADGEAPDVDWEALAHTGGTLVILMGMGRLEAIGERLIEAGCDPKTPVALIRNGARPDQETLEATLADVAEQARRRDFQAPAAIVVGPCVALRSQLAWFEKRPLFGLRAAVTRPHDEAEEINARLRAAGAEVIHCPTIRVESAWISPEMSQMIGSIQTRDWLILTSVNGVSCFFRALENARKDARALGGVRIAVIGVKTAEELRKYGIVPDLVPEEFSQEGILEAMGNVDGSRILIARAAAARPTLTDTLTRRGAQVDILPLYRTLADEAGLARLKALLESRRLDLVTFTSASTAQMLLGSIPKESRKPLFDGCKTASIGPATSAALRAGGLDVDIEAKVYTANGLFEAIMERLAHSPAAGQA